MRTIVITGAGGPAGRALIEQLAHRRVADESLVLVGADMRVLDDQRLSLSAVLPAAADPEFSIALRHLIGAVRADLVIPTVAEELPITASLESVLNQDPSQGDHGDPSSAPVAVLAPWLPPPIAIAPGPATAIASDKLHTMWALDAAGVAVPRYSHASAFATTEEAYTALGGPIVVKPRLSRGGRGVQLIDDPASVDWSTLPPAQIVQRFAPGTEYCPQVYRSWNRGESDVVVLEKVALRDGRVGNAEGVRRLEAGEADDVACLAARAVEALGLLGPVDLDIRRGEDGVPVVLEVNPRFGAWSAAAPEILDALLEDVFGPGVSTSR